MKQWKDESGQILLFAIGGVIMLSGFLALALDVSLLFRAKRNLQIAADSAATAAALDYYYNCGSNGLSCVSSTGISEADGVGVQAAALDNVKTVNGTTVDVHCPVQNGVYKNSTCNGYFEAIVQQPNSTVFMGFFNRNSVTVAARAVAGTPYVSSNCATITQPSGNLGPGGGNNSGVNRGTASMWLQGSFDFTAPNCDVVVDGTSSNALDMQGSGGTLTAGSVGVVGKYTGSDSSPTPVTGVAPVINPLKSLCVPSSTSSPCSLPASCTSGGSFSGTASSPLTIGTGGAVCYSGDSSGNLKLSNVTFNGTFIFTGSGTLTFGGNISSDSTNGSTIDLAYPSTATNLAMTESSGTVFNLSAPTASTSAYQGIVLMAPTTNQGIVEFDFGNASGAFTGAVSGITYLPDATLFLHDSGGDHSGGLTLNTDLIVGQLDDVTASININSYSKSNPTLTPLKAVALVE